MLTISGERLSVLNLHPHIVYHWVQAIADQREGALTPKSSRAGQVGASWAPWRMTMIFRSLHARGRAI